ncbi:MAG: dienelactone hydrolase family protein [Leptospirales bacterium]
MTTQAGKNPFLDNEHFSHIPVESITISETLNGAIARPLTKGLHPAVLVYMEAYGLNSHIRETLQLLASHGTCAIAPDIYHGKLFEYQDSTRAIEALSRLNDAQVMKETRQTLDYLGTLQEVRKDAVGVMGYCMGGRYTFLSMTEFPDRFHAGVAFYGGSIGIQGKDRLGRSGVLDRASALEHPILLLYGADDPSILPGEHAHIAETLSRLKKEYQMAVFPNAAHGFFNWYRDSFSRPAANRAWRVASPFMGSILNGTP